MKNKLLAMAAILTVGTIAHQMLFSVIPLWKVPKLMSSMRAKEFCTCRFMLKNSTELCLDRVKKGYPLFSYGVDEQSKKVYFSNYLSRSEAKAHVDRKYGCSIK